MLWLSGNVLAQQAWGMSSMSGMELIILIIPAATKIVWSLLHAKDLSSFPSTKEKWQILVYHHKYMSHHNVIMWLEPVFHHNRVCISTFALMQQMFKKGKILERKTKLVPEPQYSRKGTYLGCSWAGFNLHLKSHQEYVLITTGPTDPKTTYQKYKSVMIFGKEMYLKFVWKVT